MGTLSLRLPDSLHERLRRLARQDGVSVNQFITTAAAEKAESLRSGRYVDRVGPRPSLEHLLGAALARESDVVFAYLFGSQASGRASASSDIDVAVYLAPGVDAFEAHLRLLGALHATLGTERVDLVMLNSSPIALAGRVLSTRRVLVDRQPYVRHAYESRTAREFADFRLREHRLLDTMVTRG